MLLEGPIFLDYVVEFIEVIRLELTWFFDLVELRSLRRSYVAQATRYLGIR